MTSSTKMLSHARVILRTFNGASAAPTGCSPGNNFWRLIGEKGTVVEPVNSAGRVLVQWDEPVSRLGLHCHNPVPNSLYILASDLQPSS